MTSPATPYLGLPTVEDILALPEVRRGHPTVEAGRTALGRSVRWAHVSEVADIGYLLQGGELILSTGVAFPRSDHALARYASDLAAANATGIVIELGRRFTTLPTALIQSAEAHNLPLIALHTEVPFVAITEAIHSIIVNAKVHQLQLRDTMHQTFRSLAAEASSPQDIVEHVARLAGCPVVFETVARRVVAFAGTPTNAGANGAEVLDQWERRSRQASGTSHATSMHGEQWLITTVGARGHTWGRLILLPVLPVTPLHATILEQGATTLALHLLIERDERLLEQHAHRTLVDDMLHHRYRSPDEIHARTEALGVPTRRRSLVVLIVRSEESAALTDIARHERARDETTAISSALGDARATALIALLEPGRHGLLLSARDPQEATRSLEPLSLAIHKRLARLTPPGCAVIGVGPTASSIDELGRAFAEATEAADAARGTPGHRPFVTSTDIRLRGLVHLLREDPRLQRHSERELGPLIEHDEQHGTRLMATLAAYLGAGGNKSSAASAAGTTRATLYHHLSRIEHILHCDLECAETRYSLFVALLARQSLQDAPGSFTGATRRP